MLLRRQEERAFSISVPTDLAQAGNEGTWSSSPTLMMTLLKMEVKLPTLQYNIKRDSLAYLSSSLQPALVRAILAGNIEEVEEILEKDPEAVSSLDSEKRSPLHAAAFMGYAEIVELLITKGSARVSTKDNQWRTPLHRACRSSAEVRYDYYIKEFTQIYC